MGKWLAWKVCTKKRWRKGGSGLRDAWNRHINGTSTNNRMKQANHFEIIWRKHSKSHRKAKCELNPCSKRLQDKFKMYFFTFDYNYFRRIINPTSNSFLMCDVIHVDIFSLLHWQTLSYRCLQFFTRFYSFQCYSSELLSW